MQIKAWLLGFLAWAIPGAGHCAQGRWVRGVILGASVLTMCVIGLMLGGQFNDVSDSTNGLLPRVFGLFNSGIGLLYGFAFSTGAFLSDPSFPEAAKRETFEYGNTFLMVAGLLNYLVALDAFDVAVNRKA
jgi:hypothetical protein